MNWLNRKSWMGFVSIVSIMGSLLSSTQSWAGRSWQKVNIPGAVCGDGQPYHVFFSSGDPQKLAFDLMGGGACWDAASCYGLPDTWTHPIPFVIESTGFVSSEKQDSPVYDATLVYFPYCTADIHLGRHVAHYGALNVHHEGGWNFERALQYLVQQNKIRWENVRQFTLMGYSAGALGALVHSLMLDRLLPIDADKVLIADAPGLHFGPDFWKKFSKEQVNDFNSALSPVGVAIDSGSGNLSHAVTRLCAMLPSWRVGILQGSKDVIMSWGFGNISPSGEEALMYGEDGLFKRTSDPTDNCAMWAPSTYQHTFLMSNLMASAQTSDGMTAMGFVSRLVNGFRSDNPKNAGPNSR